MTPRAVTLAAKELKGEALAQAFLAALKLNHIRPPLREYVFHPTRKWRFDFSWPSARVALEVEGGAWKKGGSRHTRGAGFLGDMAKYNAAVMLRWRVLRCTPQTLCDPETIESVRQLLGARVEITVEAM